jgi:hypothetical protein
MALRVLSGQPSSRTRRGIADFLLYFSAGLIVWNEAAVFWTVFPIERELPFGAPDIGIYDLASKVETGSRLDHGTPLVPAEIRNLSL